MVLTTEYTAEILEILSHARKFNSQIGNYVEHYRTVEPRNGYCIRLANNASVFIHKSVVDDYPYSLMENERISKVAESFETL